ncbi:hypothetical protein LINPERPRIM_LOCUS21440 [Linum perenne]
MQGRVRSGGWRHLLHSVQILKPN